MSPETTNGVLSYAEELANVCTRHAAKEAEPALRRCIQTVVEALADGSSCVALESLPKGTGETADSLQIGRAHV